MPRVTSHGSRRADRAGFSLVEVLVVVAIIAVLLGLLLPAIQAAREASRRSACSNRLRQLVVATLNYESQQRVLPAGALVVDQEAQQGVSWRVLILPYLEEDALYRQIDPQPAGLPVNRAAGQYVGPLFQCPSSATPVRPGEIPVANYDAVSGAGANAGDIRDLDDQFCGDIYTDGIYYPGSRTNTKDITDGTSHTLALGERSYDLFNWLDGVNWIGAPDVEMCAYATKNVRYPINAGHAEFGYSISDRDAPTGATKSIVRNDLFFGSGHSGGAFMAIADGSVEFVDEAIDFLVYKDLASKAGTEVPSR
jgi:prepilin-type N-terminal cleavage/methylation domain-containing protein